MVSKVYFANIDNVIPGKGINNMLDDIFEKPDFENIFDKGDTVAIKMNTGEAFADSYIRPSHIRKIVDNVQRLGGVPAVVEATPLYKSVKFTSKGFIESAAINGFSKETMGCPVLCAEGMTVTEDDPFNGEYVTLPIPDGTEIQEIEIGAEFVKRDAIIVCATISPGIGARSIMKHIGMGCAAKKGKARIHEVTKPLVDPELCIGCGACEVECAWNGIKVINGTAVVDLDKCKGCITCFEACCIKGAGAISMMLPDGIVRRQLRVVDSAAALIRQKRGKCGYFGFLLDIKGECECHAFSKKQIIADIGVLASRDPVALDAAAYDIINAAPGVPGSIAANYGPGTEKLKIWPGYDWNKQLEEAEKLKLGTRKYELVEI